MDWRGNSATGADAQPRSLRFMADDPELDPSKTESGAVVGVRLPPTNEDNPDELAELAARFASRANGGLSSELSAELALEILLNEIAEQACAATGASGAAIALERDGEMVCRATSGPTAPDLGSRVDLTSGLSGKCVQTKQTQRCEDVLADPLADIAASERLGVRSLIVMPLLQGQELIGVFELFSSLPLAFGESDENILSGLAQRALNNIERSKQPLDAPSEMDTVAAPVAERVPDPVTVEPQSSGIVTWALVAGIVITAMLLGMALGRHVMMRRLAVHAPAASSPMDPVAQDQSLTGGSAVSSPENGINAATANPNQAPKQVSLPPGSLAVYQDGKQIFRVAPGEKGTNAGSAFQVGGLERASKVNKESAAGKIPRDAMVLYRVDPAYPEAARKKGIYGPVVLDVYIGKNGSVQGVQVVSGPAELSEPSIAALKQWRFKPLLASGSPAEMQTRVTLNYVLPK